MARSLTVPFILTARAENFVNGRHDLDDTIRRLQAFEAAGADVLYAPGLKDLATIKAVVSAVTKPVNVVMSHADPTIDCFRSCRGSASSGSASAARSLATPWRPS